MATFKIFYEIEVEADDFEDAALEAEDIMLNYDGETCRPVFDIINTKTEEKKTIDLEDDFFDD